MNAGRQASTGLGRFYGLSQVFRVDSRPAPRPPSGGICPRTAQVRAALLAQVMANEGSVSSCAQVTDAHLGALTGTLDLSGAGIAVLAPGDFAGLGGIAALDLSGNALAGLLSGTFDGLDATLTRLDLSDNALSFLPARIFEDLTGSDGARPLGQSRERDLRAVGDGGPRGGA